MVFCSHYVHSNLTSLRFLFLLLIIYISIQQKLLATRNVDTEFLLLRRTDSSFPAEALQTLDEMVRAARILHLDEVCCMMAISHQPMSFLSPCHTDIFQLSLCNLWKKFKIIVCRLLFFQFCSSVWLSSWINFLFLFFYFSFI